MAEIILFSVAGAVIYAYTGNQYMTAPAFGSLQDVYKKVSFSFMIPTLVFLGVLYASVSARFIFFRLFEHSRHKNEHTVVGWGGWALILRTLDTATALLSADNVLTEAQSRPGSSPSSLPRSFPSFPIVSISRGQLACLEGTDSRAKCSPSCPPCSIASSVLSSGV